MLAQLINTPCVLTRRLPGEGEDDYGNRISRTETVETVCELQQQSRDEPGNQGELSDTHWTVFFPAGTELDTGDTIEIDGTSYEMVGDPWPARNPRTQQASHVEATLRRTGKSE